MRIASFAVTFALPLLLVPAVAAGVRQEPPEPPAKKGRASLAEFERRLRDLVKLQKEGNELADRVKGNPNASQADVARLQALQSKISESVSDLATYMDQPQFTEAQRAEMQKMWERALAEGTPSKSGPDGGKS